ncbi:hypothetical protein MGYG_04641 [Nannizzia gypsea CBS 118893]|uniref:Uncharacterized protein n=1 Tax=Arthroderma gypseum (strain ATCC MYA-4604 / CBS 118893) TaxID=535722 RepID=E4UVX8_ARTGP|nr:hypothetical protein MGYG_04641 [Nannizzia gypsea CBS 118893]EFR01639.1 hypothetical protein MGYG_04641 [Nannizzia gypsea CBS 118893]
MEDTRIKYHTYIQHIGISALKGVSAEPKGETHTGSSSLFSFVLSSSNSHLSTKSSVLFVHAVTIVGIFHLNQARTHCPRQRLGHSAIAAATVFLSIRSVEAYGFIRNGVSWLSQSLVYGQFFFLSPYRLLERACEFFGVFLYSDNDQPRISSML